jgi:hypothetical protein
MNMKSVLVSISILFSTTMLYSYTKFYPVEILEIYARYRASECSVCSVKSLDRGAELLDKIFRPGLVINPGEKGFAKTERCSSGELQIAGDSKRKYYGKKGDEIVYYPAVIFRYHTASESMSGIDNKDYTKEDAAKIYRSGKQFTGRIKLIPYAHGDAKTFIYDRERHVIQVHCIVLELMKK